MSVNFRELDFFQYKLLAGKEASFYVRDGRSFMYVGAEKYEFDKSDNSAEKCSIGNFDAEIIDESKDLALKGFIWLWQKDEYYALVFFDHTKKHPPIAIKFGNALKEE